MKCKILVLSKELRRLEADLYICLNPFAENDSLANRQITLEE